MDRINSSSIYFKDSTAENDNSPPMTADRLIRINIVSDNSLLGMGSF